MFASNFSWSLYNNKKVIVLMLTHDEVESVVDKRINAEIKRKTV
jgi:hypothetical protein